MMVVRLLRGIGANTFQQVVVFIVQIVLVPVFATRWGLERYGIWLLLSSVPSYLSLSDFGFATAAASDMTMRVARGDQRGALVTFQSTWVLIGIVSAVLTTFFVAVVWFIPASNLPSDGAVSASEMRSTLVILGVFALVSMQGSIFHAGFQCAGRYARGISLSAVTSLVEGAAAVCVLTFGGSLRDLAASYLVCRTISLLLQSLVLGRTVPWLSFGYRHASWTEIRRLYRPAVAVMALPFAQAVFLQGTIVVIGVAASPAAVPAFTAVRTLTRTGVQFATMVNHAIMPEMASAVALEDVQLQARIIAITLQASALMVLPLACGILVLGRWFVGVWTHGAIEPSGALIAVMTFVMVLQGFWVPLSNLLLAANRHSAYSYVFLATSVFCTALSYATTLWLGPFGAGLALLCMDAVMTCHVVHVISTRMIMWRAVTDAAPRPRDMAMRLSAMLSGRRHAMRS